MGRVVDIVALLLLLLLCSSGPAAAAPGFVEANGPAFALTDRTWRPFGFNQYRLTSMPGGYVCDPGYGAITDASLGRRLDEMKAAGANVVRTWFFQVYLDRGGWAPFDRVLAAAATRGMTVIPVLVNQYTDCEPPSIEKNHGFYASAFRSPGFGYGRSFKDYARMVAARYRDNRAVAFWQLVNEAEPQFNGCPGDAAAVLRAFASEMRAELRAVDPNHLVSLGTIGSGQCGARQGEYKSVHEVVDLCELHDYGSPQLATPGDAFNGVALRIRQCNELGKPIFVGESGIRADVGPAGQPTGVVDQGTLARRAGFFAAKIGAQVAAGVDGYLPWEKIVEDSDSAYNLAGDRLGIGRLGTAATEDPVAQVVRDAAPRPSPTIDSGPSGPTKDRTPTFAFSSRQQGAFECRVEPGPFLPCSSPHTTTALPDGAGTFEVRAADAPDADPTPASRSFTVDSTPPPAPTLTATVPPSPANDNSPKVKGSAPPGSTVRLYAGSSCTGPAVATGPAAQFAAPGLTVTVTDDSTTTFRGTATDEGENVSECSTSSITYVEDSTPPAPPSLTDTVPAAPANDNSPRVRGVAETGSTVRLYSNASCSGTPLATGSAAAFASPGLTVAVADDSTTTLRGSASDTLGNASACSTGSITYVEDSTPPAPPTLADTDPDSPANDNSPSVKGTAEAGSTVRLYATAACAGVPVATGPAATLASAGLEVAVADDTTTTVRARAIDAAANASACSASSIAYVEDSTPPTTMINSGPAEGESTTDVTPTFGFSSSENGSTFRCGVDDPDARAPCSSPYTTAALADGEHTFVAAATDSARNRDPRPAARTFTVKAQQPPPPPACPQAGNVFPGTGVGETLVGTAFGDLLLGGGGDDVLRGLAGGDCLYGEQGADVLLGGPGNDRALGGDGPDRVGDSRGDDRLSGGPGDDRLAVRDQSRQGRRRPDKVSCGPGRDVAGVDRADRVARDCERVRRR